MSRHQEQCAIDVIMRNTLNSKQDLVVSGISYNKRQTESSRSSDSVTASDDDSCSINDLNDITDMNDMNDDVYVAVQELSKELKNVFQKTNTRWLNYRQNLVQD